MAIEKDVKDIDEAATAKEVKPEAKPAPKLATEKFGPCPDCDGTGLQGDALCSTCGGSGQTLS